MHTCTASSCHHLAPNLSMASSASCFFDVPGLHAIKLHHRNYPLWRSHLLSLLAGDASLTAHLDGSLPPPPPALRPADFARWFCTDQVLVCLIYATLSDDVLLSVLGAFSSHDLWTTLEEMFASADDDDVGARVLQLQVQLQSVTKGEMGVQEYFGKIRAMADVLADMETPVEDSDLVLFAITGLGPEYDSFVSSLSAAVEPPAFEELYRLLLCHESAMAAARGFSNDKSRL